MREWEGRLEGRGRGRGEAGRALDEPAPESADPDLPLPEVRRLALDEPTGEELMGVRGPVPAPENVRELRGMKKRKTPDGRPARAIVLAPKSPSPPAGLSRAAGAEWRRVSRELARAGVLAEVDRGVLTAYVTAWAHMMEAEAILRRDGVTLISSRDKAPVRHPAWQVYREANRTMLAAAVQLYITPVARLRIPVAAGAAGIGDDDDDDAFD